MPKGVPVATVGINNARNAGILAARILGIKYPEIRTKLDSYIISENKKVGYDLEVDVKDYLETEKN
jgi:5-(carboxyamino)imidazole ribonucleotide mutase